MSELKPKDSGTWIWVTVTAAIIGCVGFMCVSLICVLPGIINAFLPTQPASSVSSTQSPAPLKDSPYVGLWQYPDRWVWIKITRQGQSFQCRIDKDRTLFRSEGILVEGDQIIWQENWGVDSITREANHIILDGKYGIFEYELTDTEMDLACEPPF